MTICGGRGESEVAAMTHMRRCEERLLASGPTAMWRLFGLSAPENTLKFSTTHGALLQQAAYISQNASECTRFPECLWVCR